MVLMRRHQLELRRGAASNRGYAAEFGITAARGMAHIDPLLESRQDNDGSFLHQGTTSPVSSIGDGSPLLQGKSTPARDARWLEQPLDRPIRRLVARGAKP
jgi:hypothetical protein